MAGVLYTGISGGGQMNTAATGSTRWNTTTNSFQMYDGYQWQTVSPGNPVPVTLADMVQGAEDQIAVMIEEEYKDNVAIQDAFDQWEEANKRFKVILAIAGNK